MVHNFGAGDAWRGAWGTRALMIGLETPVISLIQGRQDMVARPLGLVGQRLGGIGFYRTETGQPRFNEADGAYLFDTYATTYSYADGQYSFALQVALTLTESLNLSDAGSVNVNYAVALSEAMNLVETLAATRAVPVGLTESFSVADTYALSGVYGIILPESLVVSDTIGTNASLIAYAVNLTTGALTTYENFNFNSFAEMNGRFYGATSDGIFELTGATDAGANISTSVKFGTTSLETDFVSSESMKRLPAVYLGINTDGNMMLKVTTNGTTNTYQLVDATNSSLHAGRMLLGKGVVSRYWDFELVNVDGADFTLESITLLPEVLVRRIIER